MRNKFIRNIIAVVSLATVLTGCGMSQEAKAVQEMIDQMPEIYSMDIKDDLLNVRIEFDSLSEDDKKYVNIEHLEELEKEYNEELANKINTSIEKITISADTSAKMNKGKNDIKKVMKEIEKLPDPINDLIDYDVLLNKVKSLSESYSAVMADANDVLLMTDIFEKLDLINTAYSSSAKYGYACDISSDVSSLSSRWSSKKGSLNKTVEELKDACLYKEDFEITVAVLHVVEESSSLSNSITGYYDPFLSNTFSNCLDDCQAWEQTIKENMEK